MGYFLKVENVLNTAHFYTSAKQARTSMLKIRFILNFRQFLNHKINIITLKTSYSAKETIKGSISTHSCIVENILLYPLLKWVQAPSGSNITWRLNENWSF